MSEYSVWFDWADAEVKGILGALDLETVTYFCNLERYLEDKPTASGHV